MVHERHGVERGADEHDLPGELDDARVVRAVPVGVVVRMPRGDVRRVVPDDGGDACLGMAGVDGSRPGADRLRNAAVVPSGARDGGIVRGMLGENELALGVGQGVQIVGRRVLPARIRRERPARTNDVEECADDRLRAADDGPERRHAAVDDRDAARPKTERAKVARQQRASDEHGARG
jgi:hypothetical protein